MITRELVLDDALSLSVDTNAVLAVAEVESANSGFLSDGRPAILFEAQWFHHFTGGQYDASHPGISSPTWNRALYKGGYGEWDRLNEAMALDAEAALKSASWGAFQIMGMNFAACGFGSVDAYVSAEKQSINSQIAAFTAFIGSNPGLLQAMRSKDWQTFARLYNGPGAVASYSAKIGQAYQMHARGIVPAPAGLLSVEGPPIPDADPTGPPVGYMETSTGNVVRTDPSQSGIVKTATQGGWLAKIGVGGSVAAPIVGAIANADWKVIGIVCAFTLILSGFAWWQFGSIIKQRFGMSKAGIA
jgi:hypothetical protein